jgi:hypothetical protein
MTDRVWRADGLVDPTGNGAKTEGNSLGVESRYGRHCACFRAVARSSEGACACRGPQAVRAEAPGRLSLVRSANESLLACAERSRPDADDTRSQSSFIEDASDPRDPRSGR